RPLGSILWALARFACLCGVAVAVDLPETHPPARRSRDGIGSIFRSYTELLMDAQFFGSATPVGLALGLIFAYVASAPSLFMQILRGLTKRLQPALRRQRRRTDRGGAGQRLAHPPPRHARHPALGLDRQRASAFL